jgi:hypothetical protein
MSLGKQRMFRRKPLPDPIRGASRLAVKNMRYAKV